VCVAVHNTGPTELSAVQVRDLGLDLAAGDFTVLDDGTDPLAPGGRLLLWAVSRPEPGDRSRVEVSAVPVDAGRPLRVAAHVVTEDVELAVLPDASPPGFGEAVATGWAALRSLARTSAVAVGAAIPFLWVVPLGVVAARWHRRRAGPDPRDRAPVS
jgi:hypothetical protein